MCWTSGVTSPELAGLEKERKRKRRGRLAIREIRGWKRASGSGAGAGAGGRGAGV